MFSHFFFIFFLYWYN